jgi:hypothetical protein
MNDRLSSGIAAAAVLGLLTGIAIAPRENRTELVRRLRRGTRRLIHILVHDQERIGLTVGLTATRVADFTQAVIDRVADSIAATGSPLARIRRAFGRHPKLRIRAISVDAVGNMILLQGLVENEDECQAADLLARAAAPEGTIRNLLRISRDSTAQ